MAKALLLRAMRDAFGHFVEGLDPENLQVGVWSGEIVLEKLSLKKDSFDVLDLPIELICGTIKSLKINVPWNKLGSEPVRVVIDGIYALAILKDAPTHASSSSNVATDFITKRKLREKRRKLRWSELVENVDNTNDASDASRNKEESEGFWSRLLAKILDNLVVEIKHAHVRIEDRNAWTKQKFSFGISLERFSGTTCDENGVGIFVDRASNSESKHLLHRLIQCENLSLYLDPEESNLLSASSQSSLTDALHASQFDPHKPFKQQYYILSPCSPSVVVTKNEMPSQLLPRWMLKVELVGVHLNLLKKQYVCLNLLTYAMESQIISLNPNKKPLVAVASNPRAWWRYAIQRVLDDNKAKKRAVARKVVDRDRYVSLYKRSKQKDFPWVEELREEERQKLAQYEDAFELTDTLVFRAQAVAELRLEKEKRREERREGGKKEEEKGWFRALISSPPSAQFQLTAEEKQEIERAISYLGTTQALNVSESTLNLILRAHLRKASATLCLDDLATDEVLHVELEGESRTETCLGRTWRTVFELNSFCLSDRCTPDTLFPLIVCPQLGSSRASSIVSLAVEVKPLNRVEDVSVNLKVVPLKMVLIPSWVQKLLSFFEVSETHRLSHLNQQSSSNLNEWTENRQDEIVEALARRTLVNVNVEINNPLVLLPLVASSLSNAPLVILDLGLMKMHSTDVRLSPAALKIEKERENDLAIDSWNLRLSRVKALLVPRVDVKRWEETYDASKAGEKKTFFHVVEDFDVALDLSVCILPTVLKIAKTKLQLESTSIRFNSPPSVFNFADKLFSSWGNVVVPRAGEVELRENDADEEDEDSALFQVQVQLESLSMKLTALKSIREERERETELAMIQFTTFSLQYEKKKKNRAGAVLSLGFVQVFNLRQHAASGKPAASPPLLLSSLVDSGELIRVEVEVAALSRCSVQFNHLIINWDPETIAIIKEAYWPSYVANRARSSSQPIFSPSQLPNQVVKKKDRTKRVSPFHLHVELKSVSLVLCKGSSLRTLAVVILNNSRLSVERKSEHALVVESSLDHFKVVPEQSESFYAPYLFVAGDLKSINKMFDIKIKMERKDFADIAFNIGPAVLVYDHLSWLEVVDYFFSGVLGTILISTKESVDDFVRATGGPKFALQLQWNSAVILLPSFRMRKHAPSTLLLEEEEEEDKDEGEKDEVLLTCTNMAVTNAYTERTGALFFELHAREVNVRSKMKRAEEGDGRVESMLGSPVSVALRMERRFHENGEIVLVVSGNISAIQVQLTREQYFLLHRLLNDNLLADVPATLESPTFQRSTSRVNYTFGDLEQPLQMFDVSLKFEEAGVKFSEVVGEDLAVFAMRKATLVFLRDAPKMNTKATLAVENFDLRDERRNEHWFKYLILCDATLVNPAQPSFHLCLVPADKFVSIDLFAFRSILQFDLLLDVVHFITTTKEDTAEDTTFQTASTHPLEAPEGVLEWRGKFELKNSLLFFVKTLASPDTDCLGLFADMTLDWKNQPKAFSWGGRISSLQLFRVLFPEFKVKADEKRALMNMAVGTQLLEPTDFTFLYQYEKVDERVHSNSLNLNFEQLEMFFSITDLSLLHSIYRNAQVSLNVKRTTTKRQVLHWKVKSSAGEEVFCWSGGKSERPSPWRVLPVERVRNILVKTGKFSVRIPDNKQMGIQLLEHDGFLTVAFVEKTSPFVDLVQPGDVLLCINHTPVLTKPLRYVTAFLAELSAGAGEEFNCITFHPFDSEEPLVLKDSIDIEGKVIVCHFIDDLDQRDFPLSHLSLSKIILFRNNNGNNIISGATLRIAMHYFDSISGRWERLMKDWVASLSLSVQPNGLDEMSLHTVDAVDIQLSDMFVRASSDACRRALELDARKGKEGERPFCLRNRTGMQLAFSYEESEGVTRRGVCGAGEDVFYGFVHSVGAGKGKRRDYTQAKVIRVELVHAGQAVSLPPITCNLVHRGFMEVEGRGIKVQWEVSLQDGRLHLELRSFRRVKNELKCAVAVLGEHEKEVGPLSVVVRPGELVSLPLTLGGVEEIRVRPLFDEKDVRFRWSEPIYAELASQGGTSHVVCVMIPPSADSVLNELPNQQTLYQAKYFYMHVKVEREEADGVTIRFTIHPPIVICNLLPASLGIRMIEQNKELAMQSIKKGHARNVHSLTLQGSKSLISFRLKHSEWSQPMRVEVRKTVATAASESDVREGEVHSAKKKESLSLVRVKDGDGNQLALSVVQESTPYEGVRIVVFSAVWVINRTSLPLSFGYGAKWTSLFRANSSLPSGLVLYSATDEGKIQVKVVDKKTKVESEPSAPINVNLPDGKSRLPVVPSGAGFSNSFDLAASVDVGSGDFFRTNIVTFAPRYVFSNGVTNMSVCVRQMWEDMKSPKDRRSIMAPPASLLLHPNVTRPFWASASTGRRPFKVQLCVMEERERDGKKERVELSEWSIGFIVEHIFDGRQVVPVELKGKKEEVIKFGIEVVQDETVAGSFLVKFSGYETDNMPEGDKEADKEDEDNYQLVSGGGEADSTLSRIIARFGFPKVTVTLRRDQASKHSLNPKLRRGGDSREVGVCEIHHLNLRLAQRSDKLRELSLQVTRLHVVDPFPQSPFRLAVEGSISTEKSCFLDLHVVQKHHAVNAIFDRFKLKTARLNIKVDERFVLDVAAYAVESLFVPLSLASVTALENKGEVFIDNLLRERKETAEEPVAKNALIYFDRFYVAPIELKLWYHQAKVGAQSSLVSFGIFSRLSIKIAGARIRFGALSLRRPLGSSNLYTGIIRDHYESEFRSQIGGLMLKSISFSEAPMLVAETLFSKLWGSEVKSSEFKGDALSNDEIIQRYRRRLMNCKTMEDFVKGVVRNAVFDWSYNHTGLFARRALIVGIVNRAERDLTVKFTVHRGQSAHLLPGGLHTRQLQDGGVNLAPPVGEKFSSSSTCLLLAWGTLNDIVHVTVRGDTQGEACFVASFDGVKSLLHSKVGFSAAFLAKDISSWLSWYVLIVDDQKHHHLVYESAGESARGSGTEEDKKKEEQEQEIINLNQSFFAPKPKDDFFVLIEQPDAQAKGGEEASANVVVAAALEKEEEVEEEEGQSKKEEEEREEFGW